MGEDGIVGAWSPHGPFNNASLLIDDYELYSLFSDRLRVLRAADELRHGPHSRLHPGDRRRGRGRALHRRQRAGRLPRPAIYDRYILPFEKKYIEFVQQNGTPAMYHNCGQIMALAESYKELGVRVVEPFSPPPLGDADLARKEIVGDAYVILGGIDQVNVLQNGTVDQVKRATAATIKAGKPGGRFILQPVDFLEYGTPLENIEAYVSTAMEQAAY